GRERWWRAGFLWGLALCLKPQGMLLAPLWLAALLAVRPRRKVLGALAIACVVVLLGALPFWLSSGNAWFDRTVTANLLDQFPAKTLSAFNVWYLDLLLRGSNDPTDPLLGFSCDAWGRGAFAVAIAIGYSLLLGRWKPRGERWVLLTGWVLLAAVMVLTRVHERYVVLCLPFLVCAAISVRPMRWGVCVVVLAATAQLTAYNWKTLSAMTTEKDIRERYDRMVQAMPAARRPELAPREAHLARYYDGRVVDLPKEWGLVALFLVGAASSMLGMTRSPPESALNAGKDVLGSKALFGDQ
ncbi:MAG: hypothetical protein ACREQ9_15030, partial [Candidatus Binatia bacterium]